MKKLKPQTSGVMITGREVTQRARVNVPDDWRLDDHISEIMPHLSEEPRYVLWNKGELKVNKVGGTDVIAYLYLEDGALRGWSI